MNIPALIFSKIPLGENSTKVLFCLAQDSLPGFDLVKSSPTQFAQENSLIRHDKFDWHVNKSRPICYFFEITSPDEKKLPVTLKTQEHVVNVTWLPFPLAVRQLKVGTYRNLLQLAVQYVSYGMIDESVLAADYDEEWIRSLLDK